VKTLKYWILTVFLAIFFASVFRIFFFELYRVSDSSMLPNFHEKEWVLVNKIHFGGRVPITFFSLPFSKNDYSAAIQLPYMRMKNFGNISLGDVIVFNSTTNPEIPIDKGAVTMSRCVALPNDTLEIIEQNVFINSTLLTLPTEILHEFTLNFSSEITPQFVENYNITDIEINEKSCRRFLSFEEVQNIQNQEFIISVEDNSYQKFFKQKEIFPSNNLFSWNRDYYGKVIIPAKNSTININLQNICLYEKIIRFYEKNSLEIKDGKILINNAVSDTYTFQYNYYFLMNDNRDYSQDSRYYGFVPETAIIGVVK